MSTVLTVVSKQRIYDQHGLLLSVKSVIPNLQYQFGEDESKYASGFLPDVFAYELYKSNRYLDWSSELKRELENGLIKKEQWHFDIRIPAMSNCSLWTLAIALVKKIMEETNGSFFTEDMDAEEDNGLSYDEFVDWCKSFDCNKNLESEFNSTISLVEQLEKEVTIFGTQAPFTFNKNIIADLRKKKNPVAEFEKRMLKLQNACLDEAYIKASPMQMTTNDGKEYIILVCGNNSYTLFVNNKIDFIIFTSSENEKELFIVPAKKVREVMPEECFFDEYSFFIDLFCIPIWHTEILPKAKQLHIEL